MRHFLSKIPQKSDFCTFGDHLDGIRAIYLRSNQIITFQLKAVIKVQKYRPQPNLQQPLITRSNGMKPTLHRHDKR